MSAPDNSSHHIYLYGGMDPITGTGFDDVLILTLPSFTWTNVWPIGEAPRWGHNCHVAGKRQMITVGGNMTNGLECDWEVKGVAVWELTTLTWGSVFMTNTTNYQVPQKVLELTGGTADGGATKKDPALGWTDQGLKTVFATRRKATLTGSSPTASATPSKSHTGAIAGGVVGGVVGLVLLAVLGFFLYRRRQRKHGPHELHNETSPTRGEMGRGKNRYELQAVNENDPAELFGPELRELESPRQAIEADTTSRTTRAELPGTNTAPGAVHGVPIVRTPGDDLPETPFYTPGLRRPSQDEVREAKGDGGTQDKVQEEEPGGVAQTGVGQVQERGKKDDIKDDVDSVKVVEK
jgi:LPXTG-motif cell wall-anchored protein